MNGISVLFKKIQQMLGSNLTGIVDESDMRVMALWYS